MSTVALADAGAPERRDPGFMPYLRVLPFLIVLAIVLFSGLKPEPVPQLFHQQDKLHHLLGFAALAFSLRLAFARVPFVAGLLLMVAAALLIELAQGLLPYRVASRWDMLANVLGVLFGWGCSLLAQGWLRDRLGAPAAGLLERRPRSAKALPTD